MIIAPFCLFVTCKCYFIRVFFTRDGTDAGGQLNHRFYFRVRCATHDGAKRRFFIFSTKLTAISHTWVLSTVGKVDSSKRGTSRHVCLLFSLPSPPAICFLVCVRTDCDHLAPNQHYSVQGRRPTGRSFSFSFVLSFVFALSSRCHSDVVASHARNYKLTRLVRLSRKANA